MGIPALGAALYMYSSSGVTTSATTIGKIRDINIKFSRDALDDTTLDAADNTMVRIPGVIDPGEIALTLHYVGDNASHQALIDRLEQAGETHNMIQNGACEGVDGASTIAGGAPAIAGNAWDGNCASAISITQAKTGGTSYRVTSNDVSAYYTLGDLTGLNGLTAARYYTFSGYIFVPTGVTLSKVYIAIYDNVDGARASNVATANNTWTRACVSAAINAGAANASLRLVNNEAGSELAYFDNLNFSTIPEWTISIPDSAGDPSKFYGRAFVKSFDVKAPVKGIIEASVVLQATEEWVRP